MIPTSMRIDLEGFYGFKGTAAYNCGIFSGVWQLMGILTCSLRLANIMALVFGKPFGDDSTMQMALACVFVHHSFRQNHDTSFKDICILRTASPVYSLASAFSSYTSDIKMHAFCSQFDTPSLKAEREGGGEGLLCIPIKRTGISYCGIYHASPLMAVRKR